jgi:hypothetical protein
MVFAINPTAEKTFKAFKEAAVAQNGTDVGYIPSEGESTVLCIYPVLFAK